MVLTIADLRTEGKVDGLRVSPALKPGMCDCSAKHFHADCESVPDLFQLGCLFATCAYRRFRKIKAVVATGSCRILADGSNV